MKLWIYKYNKETIPESWKYYFKDSIEGKEYKVLTKGKELVMSNTLVEIKSNQEILDKAYGDVLLIGLGINLINDKVLRLEKVKSVDTIEISKYVIDNVPTKTNIIKGDYKTYNFSKKYDVIWHDPFTLSPDIDVLKKYLKPNGLLLNWNINYNEKTML